MDQAAALGLGESRKVKEPVAYLNELRGHAGPVRDVRFCHKDEHVLTASDDATLQLWDRKSEFSISTFHHTQNQPVTACDLNNEQDRILSSSWDQTLRLWSLETGKEIWGAEHDCLLTGCTLEHSSDVPLALSSGDNRTVYMWDTGRKPNSPVHAFTGHTNTVTSCQMNAERNIVVSTSMDQTTAIWDMRMPHRLLISLKDHINAVCSCHMTRCGRFLVTSGYDRVCYVYDIATGMYRKTGPASLAIHEGCIGCCRYSPNSKYIVTCGYDNLFAVWSTTDYGMYYKLKNGHDDWILAADFSDEEDWLATASRDGSVRIWTANTPPTETYTDPRKMLGLNIDKCIRCGRDFSAVNGAGRGSAPAANAGGKQEAPGWCVICRLKHPSRAFGNLEHEETMARSKERKRSAPKSARSVKS
eukprot:scpid51466/ scgid4400/ WD repeat-containing protein 88; PQQ repeat and WD repeat-containing protein